MNRPLIRTLVFCVLLNIITGIVVYRIVSHLNKKTAVVDVIQLCDQYNLKKELEAHEKVKLEAINAQLDSIANKFRMAQATKNTEEANKLGNAYGYLKTQLQNEYNQGNKEINEQIWKRLNPILEEYGKRHELHLIIGANGMGTVLYNDEYFDITKDVIKYVNKKYEQGS